MKTKIDIAFQDISNRILYGTLVFTKNPEQNIKILEEAFMLVNITKGDLDSQEIELPGARRYLFYLVQSRRNVELGVCPKFKAWFNKSGIQSRCNHEEKLTPVRCNGNMERCSIPKNKPS